MDLVTTDRRVEPRERVDDGYFSVEFIVAGTENIYQFRVRDLSAHGMCVLVKKDSELLGHLKVGQTWKMKYCRDDGAEPADYLTTEIRHITKEESGRYKDHYLIGLCILGSRPKN
ncbi:MAG: PilZ domain-containing protein [Deltaproteobacteria bacterium]|nr:PilZ domain-containing protein [Deltaproteobacteria bacterium]